jgi:hypothetical protein
MQRNGSTLWGADNFNPATKLDASSYTAPDVLSKVKTVDGSGSGLDADTVDGLHASEISGAKIITLYEAGTNVNTISTSSGNSVVANHDVSGDYGIDLAGYKFLFQAALAAGRSVYFEAIFGTSATGTAYVALRDAAGNLYGQIQTSTSGVHVRGRSSAISLVDNIEYYAALWSSVGSNQVYLYSARLIII